jgi:hypothetical protein
MKKKLRLQPQGIHVRTILSNGKLHDNTLTLHVSIIFNISLLGKTHIKETGIFVSVPPDWVDK